MSSGLRSQSGHESISTQIKSMGRKHVSEQGGSRHGHMTGEHTYE